MKVTKKHRTDRANSLNGQGSGTLPNPRTFKSEDWDTCANCKKRVKYPNPHINNEGAYTCEFRRV